MLRYIMAIVALTAMLAVSGCCTAPGCGPCADGCGGQPGFYAHRPLDSFHHFKHRLACGAGCGETYYGEWRSTPPDCCETCEFPESTDPCHDCGGHCGVGGGCGIGPVRAVGRLVHGLYGKRLCSDCGYGWDDCCCEGEASGYDSYGSGCGCSSCSGETLGSTDRGPAAGDRYVKQDIPSSPVRTARNQQIAARQRMVRRATTSIGQTGSPGETRQARQPAAAGSTTRR